MLNKRILFWHTDNTQELCHVLKFKVMAEEKNGKGCSQEYAELLCDFMFKRLFGSEANKDVLIGFLNMILEDADIVDVDFIPTEHLGLTEQDRKAVFDISCTCNDGRTLIIEMQKGFQEHFRERAVYYTSFPINEQGRKAKEEFIKAQSGNDAKAEFKWDYSLNPVTVVAILNFMFDHTQSWPKDRYHSSYRLREDCTNEIMTEVVRYVFLELGRFRKRLWELETSSDKWMYLLKHMHEMVDIPNPFQTPEFKRLFLLAKIGNFTPDEFKEYEKSLNSMSDYYNIIDSAVAKAEKAALEKGREEGREETRKEHARKLKKLGVLTEIIAEATGLSIDEIEKL